jgi:hypothetical protein
MAAAYVGHGSFWFHPESMQPALTSAAHQAALNDWKALAGFAVDSSSTGDLWQSFVEGRAAFLVGSADALPFLLSASLESEVIGVSRLPGARSDHGQVRHAGNTTGANWGGVSIAGLPGADSSADFLDRLATPDVQTTLWTDLESGVNPTVVDAGFSLEIAESSGWPSDPTAAWLTAIQETQNNPLQLMPLRIAETARYLLALERRIVGFLDGGLATSTEALQLAASDWDAINQAIDLEIQRELFARSLMPPPIE